jgi:hypothetical protein
MRTRVYVITVTVSLVSVFTLRQLEPTPLSQEVDIVSRLPKEVQVLLPNGLCDNIHAVFLMEVRQFTSTPQPQRQAALERIEYYREWLRRKNCG